MAQPSNTFDSYDYANAIGDISETIYNVTPMTRRFILRSNISVKHVSRVVNIELTAWVQTHTLRVTQLQPTRVHKKASWKLYPNFQNAVTISDTDEGLNNIGKARRMAYEMLQAARAKLDIEKALFDNNARVAGNATTARVGGKSPG